MDSLKEQKIDPKVAGIILELWFKFRKVCFFSDFCGKDKDDIKLYYQRHYVQGRKDPAQAAIEGTEKKPSHNTVDMICFMKGLQQNLIHGVI